MSSDWICTEILCSYVNFARRKTCLHCKKRKPGLRLPKVRPGIGKDKADKIGGPFSEDDWSCDKCFNINWARRATCNKCDAPKYGEITKAGIGKKDNWRCGKCYNINWANRATCIKCDAPKSGEVGTSKRPSLEKLTMGKRSIEEECNFKHSKRQKKHDIQSKDESHKIENPTCSSNWKPNDGENLNESYLKQYSVRNPSIECVKAGPSNESSDKSLPLYKDERYSRYKFWLDQGFGEDRAREWCEHPLEEFLLYHELLEAGEIKPFVKVTPGTKENIPLKSGIKKSTDSKQDDTELSQEGTITNGVDETLSFEDIDFLEGPYKSGTSVGSANELEAQSVEMGGTASEYQGRYPGSKELPAVSEPMQDRGPEQGTYQESGAMGRKDDGTSSVGLQLGKGGATGPGDLTAPVASTNGIFAVKQTKHKSGAQRRKLKKLRRQAAGIPNINRASADVSVESVLGAVDAKTAALQGDESSNNPNNRARTESSVKAVLGSVDQKMAVLQGKGNSNNPPNPVQAESVIGVVDSKTAALQSEGTSNTPNNPARAETKVDSVLGAVGLNTGSRRRKLELLKVQREGILNTNYVRAESSVESSLGPLDPKRAKTQKSGFYKHSGTAVKLAVIAKDYPSTFLRKEHVILLQKLTADLLMHAPDPLPIFIIAPSIEEGTIRVTCSNDSTAQWFHTNIPGKSLGVDEIVVVDAHKLPKRVKMAYRSVNMALEDNAEALRFLERYNPSLRTNDWRVISTLVEDTSIRRVVLMDRISAGVIAEAGYTLPSLCEYVRFKLLEEPRDSGKENVNEKNVTNEGSMVNKEDTPNGDDASNEEDMTNEEDRPDEEDLTNGVDVLNEEDVSIEEEVHNDEDASNEEDVTNGEDIPNEKDVTNAEDVLIEADVPNRQVVPNEKHVPNVEDVSIEEEAPNDEDAPYDKNSPKEEDITNGENVIEEEELNNGEELLNEKDVPNEKYVTNGEDAPNEKDVPKGKEMHIDKYVPIEEDESIVKEAPIKEELSDEEDVSIEKDEPDQKDLTHGKDVPTEEEDETAKADVPIGADVPMEEVPNGEDMPVQSWSQRKLPTEINISSDGPWLHNPTSPPVSESSGDQQDALVMDLGDEEEDEKITDSATETQD